MKSFTALLFLAIILFMSNGCSTNDDTISYDLTGNWKVISFVENNSNKITENGEITIASIATTFINEPEWSKLFKITNVDFYEIRNSKLIIYRNDKRSSITLVRN